MAVLSLLDRLGRLLRGRGRQRGLGAGFLRLGIWPRRFRWNAGRPCARCHRLSGRRGLGFGAGRRLQRLGRLRQLLWRAGTEFGQRQAANDKPRRDQGGGQNKIHPVIGLPVIGRHVVHREIVRDINGWFNARFPREPASKTAREAIAPPFRRRRLRWRKRAAIPWRSRRGPPPLHCPCDAPGFRRRLPDGSSARCRRHNPRP